MAQTTHPTKEMVREYLASRLHEEEPPPTPEDIRRQLGWTMIEAERKRRPDRDE